MLSMKDCLLSNSHSITIEKTDRDLHCRPMPVGDDPAIRRLLSAAVSGPPPATGIDATCTPATGHWHGSCMQLRTDSWKRAVHQSLIGGVQRWKQGPGMHE
jgi:hypothetical protein